MSHKTFIGRFLVVVLLLAVGVTTADAAVRRRTADRGAIIATLTGRVTDSITGGPVFDAQISIGLDVKVANKNGDYKFEVLGFPPTPVRVKVQRWGYFAKEFAVTFQPGANVLNASLAPKPVALLTDLSGETHVVDAETATFDSWFPMASPYRPDPIVFYLPDGSQREVPLSQLKAVIGPGVSAPRLSSCFYQGNAVRFGVLLRSGELLDVIFPECDHYLFALSAHDREDGAWHYRKFSEIAYFEYP